MACQYFRLIWWQKLIKAFAKRNWTPTSIRIVSKLVSGYGTGYKKDIFDVFAYEFKLLRINSFLVIFRLRRSDIFALQKWYWNLRFQWYYIRPLNCPKGNITRRKPNITAKQYNSPQANITENDKFQQKLVVFLVRATGLEPARKSIGT